MRNKNYYGKCVYILLIVSIAILHCKGTKDSGNSNLNVESFAAGDTVLKSDMQEVYLDRHRVKNLRWVRKIKNLKELEVSQNPIYDIELLRNHKTLEILDIDYTYVSDLSPLENVTTLRELTVHFSKVTKVHMLPVSLKTLIIDERVDKESLDEYKKKNPNCEVIVWKLSQRPPYNGPNNYWQDDVKRSIDRQYSK